MFLSHDPTKQGQVSQGRGATVDESHVKVVLPAPLKPVQLSVFLSHDTSKQGQVSQGRGATVDESHVKVV